MFVGIEWSREIEYLLLDNVITTINFNVFTLKGI